MKKNNVLWICVVLMMAFGISSCSSDDDDDNPIEGYHSANSESVQMFIFIKK